MKKFLDEDFLLTNDVAKELYFNHAKKMPIYDFHCHLVPQEIYEDKKFKNITEAWLGANHYGDHYKWRLLRELGEGEEKVIYLPSDIDSWTKDDWINEVKGIIYASNKLFIFCSFILIIFLS